MADDIDVTPGSGKKVSTDERSINSQTVHVQRINDIGASAFAATQATCDSTADQLLAARETRKRAVLTNRGTVTAYLGGSGVATSTGTKLQPGDSFVALTTAAIYGITSSGTANIDCWEEYDS